MKYLTSTPDTTSGQFYALQHHLFYYRSRKDQGVKTIITYSSWLLLFIWYISAYSRE